MESGVEEEDEYDSVMICNGHYTIPLEPNIPNVEDFVGNRVHSHYYRQPNEGMFCDKVVLVLGAAASGSDIGLEVIFTIITISGHVVKCWYLLMFDL